MNKIANSELNGYYDQSLEMIVVYFHKTDDGRDLVAYLNKNMSWDLREISKESSTLYNDHEEVIIDHNSLGHYAMGTDLDNAIRTVLKNVVAHLKENNKSDDNTKLIEKVLANNSYKGVP